MALGYKRMLGTFSFTLIMVFCIAFDVHAEGKPDVPDRYEDVQIETEGEEDVEEFIPTHKWQIVKKGQAIPPGLHIRLNMVTGEKEAKLLDENTKTDLTVLPESEQMKEEKDARFRHLTEAVEEAYKELQSSKDSYEYKSKYDGTYEYVSSRKEERMDIDEVSKKLENIEYSDVQPTGKRYKSIEEIKEEFSHIKVDMETDGEILQGLYKRYSESDLTDAERLTILEDLEYYVHQVDNARDFAEMGGFSLVIKDLNHTNPDVRAFAASLIAGAVQSNPPVQVELLQLNVMPKLIQMTSQESLARVRYKCVYALSTLIRHFPYAQQRFLSTGGLQVLRDLFAEQGLDKLKVKAVTLVNDIVREQIHSECDECDKDETQQEKMKQYKQVPITQHIKEQKWCDVIPPLLDLELHDYREKTLRAMTTLYEICAQSSSFQNSISSLEVLESEYKLLAEEELKQEGERGYFMGVLNLIENLKLNLKDFDARKIEL